MHTTDINSVLKGIKGRGGYAFLFTDNIYTLLDKPLICFSGYAVVILFEDYHTALKKGKK